MFPLYRQDLIGYARTMRKAMTKTESKLWFGFLKNENDRWYKQKPIGPFIVDFYSAKHRLIIEVDGENHFTQKGRIYDNERDEYIRGKGYTILRVTNNEVMKEFDGVCEKIHSLYQLSGIPDQSPSASPCPP